MKHIVFEYRDEWCKDGKFHKQECWCESLEQCYKFYGLRECEHQILLVEDAERKEEEKIIKTITVWVKCPICGWNEIPQKKYEALRSYDFKNGLEMIDGFCKEMEFSRKTMKVVSSELLGNVQKFIFTIKSNVQVEHPEINQAELEVRMTVYCDSDLRATGLGGAE